MFMNSPKHLRSTSIYGYKHIKIFFSCYRSICPATEQIGSDSASSSGKLCLSEGPLRVMWSPSAPRQPPALFTF